MGGEGAGSDRAGGEAGGGADQGVGEEEEGGNPRPHLRGLLHHRCRSLRRHRRPPLPPSPPLLRGGVCVPLPPPFHHPSRPPPAFDPTPLLQSASHSSSAAAASDASTLLASVRPPPPHSAYSTAPSPYAPAGYGVPVPYKWTCTGVWVRWYERSAWGVRQWSCGRRRSHRAKGASGGTVGGVQQPHLSRCSTATAEAEIQRRCIAHLIYRKG